MTGIRAAGRQTGFEPRPSTAGGGAGAPDALQVRTRPPTGEVGRGDRDRNPGAGRLAPRPAQPSGVVLIGCGARKAPGPALASSLYTGPYFQHCLRAALALAPPDQVLILSARHGLLALTDGPVAPYDLRLGEPGAVTAATIRTQAAQRGISEASVLALCGSAYADLAKQVWDEVATPLAGLGIGQQRHALAAMRAGHTDEQGRGTGTMTELRLPALEIEQAPGVAVYLFAVDGKQLGGFTTVAQARRGGGAELLGYQRPQVLRHIEEIRRYLDSPGALLPNALTVAFDDRVRFEPAALPAPVGYARFGVLAIPDGLPEDQRPGWLVDGQQRVAAISRAARESVPVAVAAFISADQGRQREQFLRVNSVQPLPKGLLYELLPLTAGPFPAALERRRIPATLVERLNHDPASPLSGMIRTPTNPDGVIKDNSMLRTLASSLSDGALMLYDDRYGAGPDIDGMVTLVSNFWAAVRDVFPAEWGLPPRKCRLLHGAGVVALGFLMDSIACRAGEQPPPSVEVFAEGLRLIEPDCRWASGTWAFGRGWKEIQNTGQDAALLTDFLTRRYRALACEQRAGAA